MTSTSHLFNLPCQPHLAIPQPNLMHPWLASPFTLLSPTPMPFHITRLTNLSRNYPLRVSIQPVLQLRASLLQLLIPLRANSKARLSPPPRPLPSPHSSTSSGSRSPQSPPTVISPRPALSLTLVCFLSNPSPEPPAHTLKHPQDPALGSHHLPALQFSRLRGFPPLAPLQPPLPGSSPEARWELEYERPWTTAPNMQHDN